MAIWSNTTKTEKGIALEQKLLTLSKPLKLVAAKSGAGTVNPTQLAKLTNLQQPKQELELRPIYLSEENTVTVPVMLSNTGLTEGYNLFQVGLYAEDPDDGEILYIIAQTDIASGERVPSAAESPGYSIDWNFAIKTSLSSSIEVVVNEAGKLTMAQADARYVQTEEMNKALFGKVDKVTGKGLSKNDYTDEDKAKVQSALQSIPQATADSYGSVRLAIPDKTPDAYDVVTVDFYNTAVAIVSAALENKANKATVSLMTLLASGWDISAKTYSLENTYPAAQYDLSVEPDSTCTEAQLDAWSGARIVGSSAGNVLKAFGDVPAVDIPVILEVRGK